MSYRLIISPEADLDIKERDRPNSRYQSASMNS
jgi:hypothetical protein